MSLKLRHRIARTVWMSLLLVLSLSVTVGAIERGLLKKMKTEQRVALIIGRRGRVLLCGARHSGPGRELPRARGRGRAGRGRGGG